MTTPTPVLEQNPALPADTPPQTAQTLSRLFRLIAQVVNPIVAWVANWKWVTVQNVTGTPPYTVFSVNAPDPTGTSTIAMNKKGDSQSNNFIGMKDGVNRWLITLGGGESETGSNAGSDFSIYRYTDAGAIVDRPFSINRASGMIYSSTGFIIAPPASFAACMAICAPSTGNVAVAVNGYKGGSAATNLRWAIQPGNGNTETGSNVGSDFGLYRYSDTGAFLGTGLLVLRNNGSVITPTQPYFLGSLGSEVTGIKGIVTESWTGAISNNGTAITVGVGGTYLIAVQQLMMAAAGNSIYFQININGNAARYGYLNASFSTIGQTDMIVTMVRNLSPNDAISFSIAGGSVGTAYGSPHSAVSVYLLG